MENQVVVEPTEEAITINVKIVGHELISKKLFDVVMHLLVANEVYMFEECISIIRFNRNAPTDRYGEFDPETREIDINLSKHLDYTFDLIQDPELSRLSFRGHLWFGLLTTLIHEILHATAYAIDPETVINTDRKELEDSIKEEAARHLEILIRDYDVEPPLMDDDPFFSPHYMGFYVKKIKENAEQWAINQNALHATGFMWKHDEAVESSFRNWYRVSYDHADDDAWDKEPAMLLSVEVEDEVVAVETVLVVNEPATPPEVIHLPASPVEAVLAPSPEILAALPDELDAESLMALYNADEEPMETPEDDYQSDYVAPTQPAALPTLPPITPAQTTVVAPAVATAAPNTTGLPPKQETTTNCTSCAVALAMNAKFCSNCGTSAVATEKPVIPQAVPQTTPAQQPFGQPQMANNLQNYNLSAEQIRACVGEIVVRCYQHIYGKCGFRPGQNPQFAPELRNAISEPVSVLGVPCVDQILLAMDCTDSMTGRYQKQIPVVNGMIRGKTTKNMGLPSYTLYMNFNGHLVKRLILPQNQWKDNGQGGYSQPAVRAQQGTMILWMMDGDDSVPGQKWKAKIENGALEWLV